ncbi:uncharacterized protein LOC143537804 [Bidens hawaiensis]|uniref:uncharacterized protein LOC143537804 n=1 Tax=Bidens hawaiensis TaxID=980011 RepID=UPI004049C91E
MVHQLFEFKCEKVFRQGDPISPFLYLIVIEALSWVLNKAKSVSELSGLQIYENEQDITHLFYADDALILGEWSKENLEKTARMLQGRITPRWKICLACWNVEESIRFWCDLWIGETPLRESCPNLYRLEKCKDCLVESRITLGSTIKNLKWNRKKEPTKNEEVGELLGLLEQIHDYVWAQGVDSWKWVGGGPANFTVYAVKQLFITARNYSDFYKMRCNTWIPLKCNALTWRAELDRLPTRVELTKRSVILHDINCPLCGDSTELLGHLFTACIFALDMWDRVARWCRLPPLYALVVRDLLSLAKGLKLQIMR